MKRKMIVSIAVIGCALFTACGSSAVKTADYAAEESAVADYSYDNYSVAEAAYDGEWDDVSEDSGSSSSSNSSDKVNDSATSNRKLIRYVNIDCETYDFTSLTAQINSRVAALDGYIESSTVNGDEAKGNRSADYVLRIPAANADLFIDSVEGKSNITYHSERVEDVTLSYVDIQSRKESLQIEYDRLQEMLGQAETVEDMIYIEDRLSNVRYEIQSIESQLRVYDNKVDYTTISLNVSEVKEYTEPEPEDDSLGTRLKRGMAQTGENIVELLENALLFILVTLPYILVVLIIIALPILIVVWIIKAIVKKNKKKKMAKYGAAATAAVIPNPVYAVSQNAPVQNTNAEAAPNSLEQDLEANASSSKDNVLDKAEETETVQD